MRYSPPTNPFILLNPKSDISFERPRSAASRFYLHERFKRLLCFVLLFFFFFFFSIIRLPKKPALDDICSVYWRIRIFLFFFFVSFFFLLKKEEDERLSTDYGFLFLSLQVESKKPESTRKFAYLFRIPAPPVRYLAYLMIRFDPYAWCIRSSNPTYYPTYYPKS